MGSAHIYLQCLIGLQCDKFAMVAADQTQTQSIIVIKHDENKIQKITEHLVMGVNGDGGDALQFCQFIAKNMHLYKLKNGYMLNTAATAHFTRRTLSDGLRNGVGNFLGPIGGISPFDLKTAIKFALQSSHDLFCYVLAEFDQKVPFLVNLMFAGYDDEEGGQLYTLDYLASSMRVPHSTHGFGGLLSQSILDHYYYRNMSEGEALAMVKLCIKEVKQRLFVNLPKFQVAIVSKSGTKRLMNVMAESDVI